MRTIKIVVLILTFGLFPMDATAQEHPPELIEQLGHPKVVYSIAFSPDGKTLASAGLDRIIKLWDVKTGFELRSFSRESEDTISSTYFSKADTFVSVAFSPDGKTLVSGGNGGVLSWNVGTGEKVSLIENSPSNTEKVLFSSDGKILITTHKTYITNQSDEIMFWNLETKKAIRTIPFPNVSSIALSSDGELLAGVSGDILGLDKSQVKIWNINTGKELRNLLGLSNWIWSVSFSPDGNVLAAATWDGKIKVWNINTGNPIKNLEGIAVSFSPDGKFLATGSDAQEEGGSVTLWDTETWEKKHVLEKHAGGISSIVYNPIDNSMAAATYASIKLWDTNLGEEIRTLQGGSEIINTFSYNQKKNLLAFSKGYDIKVWNFDKEQEPITLAGHEYPVKSIVFSPNGELLATGEEGIEGNTISSIKIWDTTSNQLVHSFNAHNSSIFALAFSENSQILASGSNKELKLWDIKRKILLRKFLVQSVVTKITFSSNNLLASGDIGGNVKVRNTTTGGVLRNIDFSFSGKNQQLIAKSFQKIPEVYKQLMPDLRTVKSLPIFSLAFSPDGNKLAIGSVGEINIWDISTGKLLFNIEAFGLGAVDEIKFSQDGKTIFSSSYSEIKSFDAVTGKETQLKTELIELPNIIKKSDSELLLASFRDKINIIDCRKKKEVGSFISLYENDWLVTTPEGYFDGSQSAWKQLIWRFDNNTFKYAVVEAFFKEFYYPGLLHEIMKNKPPKPPERNLSEVDIRQPDVRIVTVNDEKLTNVEYCDYDVLPILLEQNEIKVAVEVTESNQTKSKVNQPETSGAQDLRLFRNNSLVKHWQGNIFDKMSGCEQITEKGEPRRAICRAIIEITADINELTAYVFNDENVKSNDTTAFVMGSDSLKRKGKLQILAIGVNEYQNKNYDLKFAVPDAVDFGAELRKNQINLNNYETPDVVQLTDKDVTKQNILYALERFAKGDKTAKPANLSTETEKKFAAIQKTQPEDVLVIYFAGHGTASKDRFYLIPTDGFPTSSDTEESRIASLQKKSISDLELEAVLRDLDAGQLMLIVDACNSGQALEAEEKRRGPMNSRGLAQLAFEKGMYILTAAQSYQAALEVSRTPDGKKIEHGLLTFSLLDGLTNANADNDADRSITEREWFSFAAAEVPRMQLEEMQRRDAEIKRGDPSVQGRSGIFYVNGDTEKDANKRGLQTPRVFYRRETSAKPFIITSFLSSMTGK